MPVDKDFKHLVRQRMAKTGESYTTARMHLRRETKRRPRVLVACPGLAGYAGGKAHLVRLLHVAGYDADALGRTRRIDDAEIAVAAGEYDADAIALLLSGSNMGSLELAATLTMIGPRIVERLEGGEEVHVFAVVEAPQEEADARRLAEAGRGIPVFLMPDAPMVGRGLGAFVDPLTGRALQAWLRMHVEGAPLTSDADT